MRRLLSYHFRDPAGIVDDYVIHALRALRPHVDQIVVVADEPLGAEGFRALQEVADRVVPRPAPTEADPGAHRVVMTGLGADTPDLDEILLMDSSCFAPVFPFADVLERMDQSTTDFWSMTENERHWLAIRRSVFGSSAWAQVWDDPQSTSLIDRLTALGFAGSAAFPATDYPTREPSFESAHLLLRDRCPILARQIFDEDPARLDRQAVLGRRVLEALEGTDYPLELLWQGLARHAEPRHVYTNLSLLEILPDTDSGWRPTQPPRIAVCAHVYYDDMIPDMMASVGTIPVPYHLDITTDTIAKRDSILDQLQAYDLDDVTVRVVGSNQGRDTSALLIAQREVLLSGDYDLICRIHSKKSPQDDHNASDLFRSHMYDNLLDSPAYVAEILRLFEEHPTLGMVFPPVVNIAYPTLGHAWFANRAPAEALAERLNIRTKFDAATPLAPYGSMFWARPETLRKLVEPDWAWTDFPDNDGYVDGSLTHVLERLLAYAVIDAGFHVRSVINRDWGSINYAFLEYKLQRIAAFLPGQTEEQVEFLSRPVLEIPLLASVKDRIDRRYPGLGQRLRPGYQATRSLYRRARGR